MKNNLLMGALLALFFLLLASCQPEVFSPPRLATATALASKPAPEAQEPVLIPAPTATPDPLQRDQIEFETSEALNVWINETSPEHREVLEEMISEFTQESGIDVSLQMVAPSLLPDLMHTAVLSDTLPDVVLHPLEYTVAWVDEGILDPEAAAAIINQLDPASFNPGALNLVDVNGQPAAVPSHGYQQLLLYRKDWVEAEGLGVPNNYEAMMENAEAFFDPENIISGIVIPTESNLISTHRAFEHLAIANGCQLIDDKGEVRLLDPACREAIEFYFSIVNQFSPTGVQTDTSARNAFLDERTFMIMTSPEILKDLAVLTPLNENIGILTGLNGWDENAETANFGNISYLGVTKSADKEGAAAFIEYWFDDGYANWLAVDSERKVPMHLGTTAEPRLFINQWGNTPDVNGRSLSDIFGADTVNLLKQDIAQTNRWGFNQGQGTVIGQLYENLTFSTVLQEMLSGYFDSTQTLEEAASRVIELIPDYQFAIEPTATPAADS